MSKKETTITIDLQKWITSKKLAEIIGVKQTAIANRVAKWKALPKKEREQHLFEVPEIRLLLVRNPDYKK
jgi:hypothetical protein